MVKLGLQLGPQAEKRGIKMVSLDDSIAEDMWRVRSPVSTGAL